MNKYSFLTVLLLFSLLFSVVAYAADFDITITAINDAITKDNKYATYNLTIKSNLDVDKDLKVDTPQSEWTAVTSEQIKTLAGRTTSTRLVLSPKNIASNIYLQKVLLNFRDFDDNKVAEKEVVVKVPGEGLTTDYLPSINTEIIIQEEADPREKFTVKIVMTNMNKLKLTDLKIRVYSDLEAIKTEQKTSLDPLDKKKAVEISYNLNPLEAPGEHSIIVELLKDENVLSRADKTFKIIESRPLFKEEIAVKDSFLYKEIDATYTSSGNVANEQDIKFSAGSYLKNVFTRTDPKSKIVVEEGKKYILFNLKLEPGESKTLRIITSYRTLLYLIILIILCTIGYYVFRAPLQVRKSIGDVSVKGGGLSELRVIVEVANISKKPVRGITVIDTVPHIAEISREFVEGTVKPHKVFYHKAKGSILQWDMAEVQPGETREICYHIKSKLSILGNFHLPRAKVIFKAKGKEMRAYSNVVGVSN